MSTLLNFDELAKDSNNSQFGPRKTAKPGVDVFTVEEAEVKNNVNGKEFIGFKFVNAEGQYFKEQFYTNGFGGKRVFELATNAGLTLKGKVSTEDVAAQLIGSKVGLIVGGEKEDAVIDGKQLVVTRAKIKGAYNFSFKATELEKYKDAPFVIEDKTSGAVASVGEISADENELPF